MTTYTILYRSGQKIRVKADGLVVKRSDSEIIEVRWDKIRPRPFALGVDDICAIFEGKA